MRPTALLALSLLPLSLAASADDDLPRVLLLGDSISIGYTPSVQQQFEGTAVVHRPMREGGRAENCAGTTNGMANIDRWLEIDGGNWDVIHFNFGLHDLKRVDAESKENSNEVTDPRQAEPETYEAQLKTIAHRLQRTGAKLIFATTTPVPAGGVRPHRDIGDPLHYNAIARRLLEPLGVQINDLYAFALPKLEEIQRPVNVHFTPAGSEQLAGEVVAAIEDVLASDTGVGARAGQPWQPDAAVVTAASRRREFNYQEEKVPQYTLPDVLAAASEVAADATPQQSGEALHAALVRQFEQHVYGEAPPRPDDVRYEVLEEDADAVDGKAIAQKIRLTITRGGESYSFPFLLFIPKEADGPVPAWVQIHNRGVPATLEEASTRPKGFESLPLVIRRGYAMAMFTTSDIDPDRKDGFDDGIRGFYRRTGGWQTRHPEESRWGSLAAWAWGASRLLDFLEQHDAVDASRVGVIGHSRGGKTSLWAGASDPRFAVAVSNDSGCGGAALSRRRFGETVARINTSFPHWFCDKFKEYNDNEDALPVDQHQLIAAIAPRAVCVGSADEDLWADPRGEYLSVRNAAPAFELFGVDAITDEEMPPLGISRTVGQTGYHVRPGGHNLTESDWIRYLDFADERLER